MGERRSPLRIEMEHWTPCQAEIAALELTRRRGAWFGVGIQNRAMDPMSSGELTGSGCL